MYMIVGGCDLHGLAWFSGKKVGDSVGYARFCSLQTSKQGGVFPVYIDTVWSVQLPV